MDIDEIYSKYKEATSLFYNQIMDMYNAGNMTLEGYKFLMSISLLVDEAFQYAVDGIIDVHELMTIIKAARNDDVLLMAQIVQDKETFENYRRNLIKITDEIYERRGLSTIK